MKQILLVLALCLLGACNTPETVLNEAAPGGQSPTDSASPDAEAPAAEVLKSGSFQNGAHEVSGEATVLQVDSERSVHLENFKSVNGPELHLYLVKNTQGEAKLGYLDLGLLKSTQGNQNYALSADIDLSEYHSLSVWCQPFGVNFGFASLK